MAILSIFTRPAENYLFNVALNAVTGSPFKPRPGSKQEQVQKFQHMLKRNLQTSERALRELKSKAAKNPSEKLERLIAGKEKRVKEMSDGLDGLINLGYFRFQQIMQRTEFPGSKGNYA